MEEIRLWAVSLCTVALGCALVQMLAPKGGMGRLLNMILAAFFLCCLFQPLLSVSSLLPLFEAPFPVSDETVLKDQFYETLRAQTDQALGKRVTAILDSYGIAVEKTEADMNISGEGAIYMRRIIVYLDEQNMKQATTARTVLSQQLDIPISIRAA